MFGVPITMMQSSSFRAFPKIVCVEKLIRNSASAAIVAALAIAFVGVSSAVAADWPQWNGPDRNAMSKEKGLLQEWPTEGPSLVRKITGLGGGDGAPAIANGRILGMGHRDKQEMVWAFSE